VESSRVVVEEAAVGAVELVQSVDGVLTRVTVDHVQQNGDAAPVCLVDQLLQLLRRPVPTATDVRARNPRVIVALVVVLWRPALSASSSASVTALR